MKKFYSCCFYLLLLSGCFTATAQNTGIPVRFAAGNFITGNNIQKQSFQKESLQSSFYNNNFYVLVQFLKLPSLPVQKNLQNAGCDLQTYLPGNAYLATIKNSFDFSQAGGYEISSINSIPLVYKKDIAFANFQQPGNKENYQIIAVSYYTSVNKATIIAELEKLGALFVPTKYAEANVVFVQADMSKVDAIAALPFVSYVALQT